MCGLGKPEYERQIIYNIEYAIIWHVKLKTYVFFNGMFKLCVKNGTNLVLKNLMDRHSEWTLPTNKSIKD